MEKKVHLKPWVQKTLEFIFILQLIFSGGEFEWKALPIILIHFSLMLFNLYLITEYGRDEISVFNLGEDD